MVVLMLEPDPFRWSFFPPLIEYLVVLINLNEISTLDRKCLWVFGANTAHNESFYQIVKVLKRVSVFFTIILCCTNQPGWDFHPQSQMSLGIWSKYRT